MERSVPLWAFILCLILWAVMTVGFGWVVKARTQGSERGGAVGALAVTVASFPSLVRDVALELSGRASGDAADQSVRIRREDGVDLTGFAPVATVDGISLPGLLARAKPAAMQRGWRLIVGAFADAGGIDNMALLMTPDLTVAHAWILDEVPVGDEVPRAANRKFVHGVEILPDGSLIFTFDGSVSLQRFDSCGKRIWSIPGRYSHSVTRDDAGASIWAIRSGDHLVRVAVAEGAIERDISVQDIIDANPMIDILEPLRIHDNDLGVNSRNTGGRWLPDAIHLNDVDPLPAAFADRFPGFAAGDLLISARSLNLLFVLDPETLRVRWWRFGQTQRQHDPDWMPSGEIMVFNNRMSRDFSEIVAIDPAKLQRRTLYDGRRNGFYSRIRGKAELLPSGALEIASPQQGKAFEVAPDGRVAFETVNTKPGSDTLNYVISEMRWLPPDFFRPGTPCIPAQP